MAQHADPSKQRRWLDLIRLWQQSQLSVRAFCLRHHVTQPSFYFWRRRLRDRGLLHDPPAPPPQPRANTKPSPTTPAFVKLTVTPEPTPSMSSALELVLSPRRLVRVLPGFDPATLVQLLRLLEEPTC